MKKFLILLSIELLAIVIVLGIFRWVNDKPIAALLAGTVFLSVGCLALFISISRSDIMKSAVFWVAAVFVLAVCIPLLGTRLMNWGEPFGTLRIWGMPGPAFHGVSSTAYLMLIAATIFDLFFIWKKKN